MPKENDQKFWFKQRYYFWQPIAWQGYATIIGFLLVTLGHILAVLLSPYSNQLLWQYLNILAMALTTLLSIGRAKGPSAEDVP